MEKYCKELEALIIDVLLPAYADYARITGRKDAMKHINADLLAAMKHRRQVPALFKRKDHGEQTSK